MKIIVYPEKLQELCREFERSASQINSMDNSLWRAVAGMDWETRRKVNIEGSMQSLRKLSSYIAGNAKEISNFLTQKAQAFIEADRGGRAVAGRGMLKDLAVGLKALSGQVLISVIASTLKGLSSSNLPKFIDSRYFSTFPPGKPLENLRKFFLGETPNQGYEADPVNTALGNYFYSCTDISINTVGPHLHVTRFYNSQRSEDGPLGVGWNFNYGIYLERVGIEIFVNWEDGKLLQFLTDGEEYEKTSHGGFSLEHDRGTGQYVLKADYGYTYLFSTNGKLLAIKDNNDNTLELEYSEEGEVERVVAASGRWLKFEYNDKGKIAKVIDNSGRNISYSYDDENNLTEVVDSCGNSTKYEYDGDHRLISVRDGLGNVVLKNFYLLGRVVAQEDAEGNTTKYTYYTPGDVVRITGPMGRSKTHVYNDSLLLVAEIDQASQTTKYEYDEGGRLVRIIDRTGITTRYVYDNAGNLVEVWLGNTRRASYEYDDAGRLVAAVDGLGRKTEYTYDERNNLVSIKNALGGTVRFVLNDRGQPVQIIDTDGQVWCYEYDESGDRVAFIDPLGKRTEYEYDACGRLTAILRPHGGRTTYAYDNNDRVTEIVDPNGNARRFLYDAVGNALWAEDPNRNRTVYEYTKKYLPSKIIDAAGGVTSFFYDACGNLKSLVTPGGRRFEYEHDHNDEVVKISYPAGHIVEYERDAEGRLKRAVSSSGLRVDYTYDEAGRLSEEKYGDGSFTRYKYDDGGNLVEVETEERKSRYEYNGLNQVVLAQYGEEERIAYEYDQGGKLVGIRYPNGKSVKYEYDERGLLAGLVVEGIETARYSYDSVGRCIGAKYANGTETVKEYDNSDRLTRLSVRGANGERLMDIEYIYDANGNRVAIRENGKETLISYDRLDRVINAKYPDGREQSFTYDADGNILRMDDIGKGVVVNEYDNAGRLVRSGDVSYSYDVDGRLVERKIGPETIRYAYDARGRMTRFEADKQKIDYSYDEDGLLISRKDAQGEIRYIYDKTRTIPPLLMTMAGGKINSFYYGRDLVAEEANGRSKLFYHQNGRYDIALITDSEAESVAAYKYDVFGDFREGSMEGKNGFGYAGELHDTDSGLVYMRKRYYDPSIGRFIAEDEFFGYPHLSQSMNGYSYCGNNPIKRIDPLGTCWFEDFKELGRELKGGLETVGDLVTGRLSIHEISPYWTESLKDSVKVVEKGLGPINLIPPVGFAMSWVKSMTYSYLYYYGEVSTPEFLWVQGNNMLDFILFQNDIKGLKYGPGRPPNPFSYKFFTGKRAQATYKWLLKETIEPKRIARKIELYFIREIAERRLFEDSSAKK